MNRIKAKTSCKFFNSGNSESLHFDKTELKIWVVHVKNDDVLWVRTEADVSSRKVFGIPYDGKGIRITGNEVKVGKSRWVPIEYKETKGWVNRSYLEKDC